MKPLSDNTQVPDRIYHYLLDFNDETGRQYMRSVFGKARLCDLNKAELIELFEFAVKVDKGKLK